MNSVDKKMSERFYMWWHCPETSNRDMAGVAYYNEEDGDYRIMINFFPENNYFLKFVGGESGHYRYRLVSVKDKGGKVGRFFQGEGVLDSISNEIIIQTAPFSKLLVVSLKETGFGNRDTNKKLGA